MRSSDDLQSHRERFMNQLRQMSGGLSAHGDFINYWKTVEREAAQTDELGRLERWVKDLSRDKERVRAVKQRLESGHDPQGQGQAILALLRQILELLEGIEKKMTLRRDKRRGVLAFYLFKAGPGVKKKPVPTSIEGAKGKKDETKVKAAVIAKTAKPKPKPKDKPKPKKMER